MSLDETRFCDDEDSTQIINERPFLGNATIHHPFTRQKLAAVRANGPNASVRPVYSTYVHVARPAFPAAHQIPAQPAYDLAREPRSICMSLNLREGYELARTTNRMEFSAEQVGGAASGALSGRKLIATVRPVGPNKKRKHRDSIRITFCRRRRRVVASSRAGKDARGPGKKSDRRCCPGSATCGCT